MFNNTNVDVTSPRQFVGTQGKTKEYDYEASKAPTYTAVDTNGNYVATTEMAWVINKNDTTTAVGNIFHPAISEVGTVVGD